MYINYDIMTISLVYLLQQRLEYLQANQESMATSENQLKAEIARLKNLSSSGKLVRTILRLRMNKKCMACTFSAAGKVRLLRTGIAEGKGQRECNGS